MNSLFFLHRLEGPFRVVNPFGCSKKVTVFDQKFSTKHNELGLQKVPKMPFFDFSRFSRKMPLERGSPPKMSKKHEKNQEITFLTPTWRPNSGPRRVEWEHFCAANRTQRGTSKNEGFAPSRRPVLRDFWGSVCGPSVLGFRICDLVFLGFLKFWKSTKKSLKKNRGLYRGRSQKWRVSFWKKHPAAK